MVMTVSLTLRNRLCKGYIDGVKKGDWGLNG